MTTTRELCDGLSAILQVPKIERWAARLVRDGFLPHAHEPVDDYEAALLLLTILGTPDPRQASMTAKRLAQMPLTQVSKLAGGEDFECWFPATKAEQVYFTATPVGLVRDILGCLVEGVAGVRAGQIHVSRDNAGVVVFVHAAGGFYRITYAISQGAAPGLRTTAGITEDEMNGLANLIKLARPDVLLPTIGQPTWHSVVVH